MREPAIKKIQTGSVFKGVKMKRQYVYLTTQQKEEIKSIATSKKLSVSMFVANLIQEAIDKSNHWTNRKEK